MTVYKATRETMAELKGFRIKLIELFILTLSVIFVLFTFSGKTFLIIPAFLNILTTLITLFALLLGANKEKELIEFGEDGQTLKSKVEMVQVTYEFTKCEYVVLSIYSVAVILFGVGIVI